MFPIMESFDAPSLRIILLNAPLNMEKTAPMPIQVRYPFVYPYVLSSVPRIFKMKSIPSNTTALTLFAFSFSPVPKAREMTELPPAPNILENAVKIKNTGEASDTAETYRELRVCPTKKVSAMLYRIMTIIDRIVGNAMLNTAL